MQRFLRTITHSDFFAFNPRNRDLWVASQAAKVPPGADVLDVGAGSAPYRGLFSHCNYRTLDFAALHSDQLRDGGYSQIDIACDAMQIPLATESVDVVLCTEVLEHHPEPIRLVSELARILRKDGVLLLTAPLGSGIHQEPYHFYGGYTPYWYQRFLTETGFGKIAIEANEGSLRHYGQESIRFMQITRPFSMDMPFVVGATWLPVWALLLPLCAGVIPLLAKLVDRFDREKRFTVGYHVRAQKRSGTEAA